MDSLEVSNTSTINVDVASPSEKVDDGEESSSILSEEERENNNVAPKVSQGKGSLKIRVKKRRRHHHVPKIFQDAISVVIPIDVRADLKIAIQKTRSKRIKSIHKRFPSLKKELKNDGGNDDSFLAEDDEGDENTDKIVEGREKQEQKQKSKLAHVPQREQFGSVVDYLEAKYVRGVMVQDEDDEGGADDISEGQGSVYSGASFLDDTDLQRDVAEQVMANTTLTKLELEEDDADFFVNVGNLEVEDNDYGEQYDPLQDKDTQSAKAAKTTKKRKKVQSSTSQSSSPAKKAKKTKKEGGKESPKKKKSAAAASKPAKDDGGDDDNDASGGPAEHAKQLKAQADAIFKKLVGMIKKMTNEELPRRKTKLKVALSCPPGKKPGDDVTFTNPHNPGQRLRVKVPKGTLPGETFRVTVPVKQPDTDNDKDCNKLPREFKDLLDDFARAHDEWCKAQGAIDKDFATFKEKQKKFEKVAKEFPSSLITPIDSEYLKLVVRRVRQYKLKKKRIQEKAQEAKKEDEAVAEDKEDESEEEEEEEEEQESRVQAVVNIPTTGVEFSTIRFDSDQFVVE